jgi:excisionase family DNA binding protein
MVGQLNKPLAYTVEQTLEILPVSRTRLYAAIGTGELRTFKDGRRRLISAGALEDFVLLLEKKAAA